MPETEQESTRRCPFDGNRLERRPVAGGQAPANRMTWVCLQEHCEYSEPEDPKALFRFAWLSPVYRALSARQEFRTLPLTERWTVLCQAAAQVSADSRPTIQDRVSGAEPAEILSWLEAQRRRNSR